MRIVLNVAEKPSIARQINGALCSGNNYSNINSKS